MAASGQGWRLAASPVSWGIYSAKDARLRPNELLQRMRDIGFDALETGPVGYFGPDLKQSGADVVGTFIFAPFHDLAEWPAVEALTRATCADVVATGGRKIIMVDDLSPDRAATAGRTEAARRLGEREFAMFVDIIGKVGVICRSYGLTPVCHPHVGTFLEFRDEIDRLMAAVPFGLCIDTAHSAYAGIDPADLVRTYGQRVEHIHLKDVDAGILERTRRDRIEFWTAMSNGIFCPIGEGMVDYPVFFAALDAVSYAGFATIEQDPDPSKPNDDMEELQVSVRASWTYLTGIRRCETAQPNFLDL